MLFSIQVGPWTREHSVTWFAGCSWILLFLRVCTWALRIILRIFVGSLAVATVLIWLLWLSSCCSEIISAQLRLPICKSHCRPLMYKYIVGYDMDTFIEFWDSTFLNRFGGLLWVASFNPVSWKWCLYATNVLCQIDFEGKHNCSLNYVLWQCFFPLVSVVLSPVCG